METQEHIQNEVSPRKKALRKKGSIYLVVFIVCLAIALLMYSAGMDGGIIYALISLAWLVFLVMSIVTLIRGFSGK